MAAIFIETYLDMTGGSYKYLGNTIAHEIGHTGGANHRTTNRHYYYIMGWEHDNIWSGSQKATSFADEDIVIFRSNPIWKSSN
jgi:hypothetical protein